jgi:hypothetical protein
MRIDLAANRLHHSRLGSPLFDWLRQHEADIQLLERAVTAVTNDVVCIASPRVARHWAKMTEQRAKLRPC